MKTEKKFIVDYTMARQYVVEVGSLWHYNRALDNSPITRNLQVKSVVNGRVEFVQKMPFVTYDIKYFDGYYFKPERKVLISELIEFFGTPLND